MEKAAYPEPSGQQMGIVREYGCSADFSNGGIVAGQAQSQQYSCSDA
jgi:hypothetical protein